MIEDRTPSKLGRFGRSEHRIITRISWLWVRQMWRVRWERQHECIGLGKVDPTKRDSMSVCDHTTSFCAAFLLLKSGGSG